MNPDRPRGHGNGIAGHDRMSARGSWSARVENQTSREFLSLGETVEYREKNLKLSAEEAKLNDWRVNRARGELGL